MTDLQGRLLVATPVIGDPNFERTVVLVLEHGEHGAVGVVLNRPTDVAVVDPLPEWDDLAATPPVVFVGGPVEQGAAIALGRVADRTTGAAGTGEGFSQVLGPIGTLDLNRPPDALAGVEQVRIFAGYAGWGAGQLEGEIDADAWVIVEARPDDVLCDRPDGLWSAVLWREGGDLALLSRHPIDPSRN